MDIGDGRSDGVSSVDGGGVTGEIVRNSVASRLCRNFLQALVALPPTPLQQQKVFDHFFKTGPRGRSAAGYERGLACHFHVNMLTTAHIP